MLLRVFSILINWNSGFSEGKTGRHRNSEIGNLMSKRDSRDLMIFAGFRGPEPCEIQPKVHYRLRGNGIGGRGISGGIRRIKCVRITGVNLCK